MVSPSAALLEHAIRSAGVDASSVSDRELLARFTATGDQAAFAGLVRRHSGMVLGVCRRALPTVQDAEDACQATFLLLARKAKVTRWQPSIANWLYTTARRVARNASVAAKRRRRREGRAAVPEAVPPVDRMTGRELLAVLDRELDRLPPIYREPLVLCYLEGLTHDEVAVRLGIAPATVKVRIHRGRKRLHAALTRRGVALGAGLLVLAATSPAEASPLRLGEAILATAIGGPSSTVAALAQGATVKGLSNKVIWIALALVGAMTLGVTTRPKSLATASPPAVLPSKAISPVLVKDVPPEQARPDRDNLPLGARLRLGAVRFRHTHWVWSTAITPDGKHLVSASQDNTLRLWDRETGNEARRFSGHSNGVVAVTVSADGKTLASSGNDGTLRLWDTATGREIRKIQFAKQGAFYAIALSPDGQTLVAGTTLWDVTTGKQRQVFGQATSLIKAVAFSPDGKTVAVAADELQLWDVATGQPLLKLVGHHRWVSSVAFSADGKRLYSGSHDDTVRVWDVASGRELRQLHGEGGFPVHGFGGPMAGGFNFHDSGVHSVALSRDGKLLASGGSNGTVKLWDPATGKELHKIQALSREVRSLAFSPDGKKLATSGFDHVINLWDTATGKKWVPSTGHDSGVSFATFSPDGRRIASIGSDRTLRVWDARSGQELHVLRRPDGTIDCAAFSPDGLLLVTGEHPAFPDHRRGKIKIWDLSTGRAVREWTTDAGTVASVAFSPDGKAVAAAANSTVHGEDTIQLWDPATGRELRTLAAEKIHRQNPFVKVEFLADGKSVAVVNRDGVTVLDAATGKELRQFAGRRTLLRDGRVLTAADDENWMRLRDVATGRELARFEMQIKFVRQFACSPDGRTLVRVLDFDKHDAIELLEVATGKPRGAFDGHQGPVFALAFSPDGKTLVSGGEDTTLLVWDVTSTK